MQIELYTDQENGIEKMRREGGGGREKRAADGVQC